MTRTSLLLAALAVVAFGVAFYCFLGYAMTASLTVPETYERDAKAALLWGIGLLGSTVLGTGLLTAAWMKRRTGSP